MLIFANPSTRPARRRSSAKGASMKKRRKSSTRRRVTRRRVTKNPTTRRSYRAAAPRRRRSVCRNPSVGGFAKGILGELASKDGLMLLGAAALAPTIVDMAAEKIVPVQYQSGWTGLLAKAALAGLAVYALDRFGKQRKAALGFAVGSGASLLAQAVRMYRVGQMMPAAPPAVADEIAKNPALFENVMGGNFDSLNGYQMAPVGGYEMAPVGESMFESMN